VARLVKSSVIFIGDAAGQLPESGPVAPSPASAPSSSTIAGLTRLTGLTWLTRLTGLTRRVLLRARRLVLARCAQRDGRQDRGDSPGPPPLPVSLHGVAPCRAVDCDARAVGRR
jgi:hypothetical protein